MMLLRIPYDQAGSELSEDTLKIRLSGNHSSVHAGCRAVWSVLNEVVGEKDLKLVGSDDFDLLIVNGEGSMHHGSATFHRKMSELSHALERGKRACLVNTVWQDNPPDFDNTLRKLDFITVREVYSQRQLLDRHGIESSVVPDLSLFFDAEPDIEPTDFQRKVIITDFYSKEFNNFVVPTAGQFSTYPFLDLNRGNWGTVVHSLTTAGLLITGRHHAVYAACRARTPFLALGGNTHKTQGFLATAGVDIPVFSSPNELLAAVDNVGRLANEYERLFDWAAAQPPWRLPQTFI